MTQKELAAAVGVHRTYIGAIERGERNPSIKCIARLARGFEVPYLDLPIRMCAQADELIVTDDDGTTPSTWHVPSGRHTSQAPT